MPVTARLSRRFYDTFGDDNTNELVGLLNSMDATYLAELRTLNEANYARFDAKLEQRIAEVRGEMQAGFAELRGEMKAGFAQLRGEMSTHNSQLRGEMNTGFEAIRLEVARGNVVALRWFIALTVTTMVTVSAAILGLLFAS